MYAPYLRFFLSFRENEVAQFGAVSFSTTSQCLISSCHSVPKKRHPPNPTSSSTTTFFSTSVHPHTHKVTLEIDKNRQDPVQPVCVCMTTTAISLFCLPVCVYLLMHIISSSSSCFSSSSSFLVCLIQLLLSLVVVVVVVFLFFVCWLVMLDFYISL